MDVVFDGTYLVSAMRKGGIARDASQLFSELSNQKNFKVSRYPETFSIFRNRYLLRLFSIFGISIDTGVECDIFIVSQVTNVYSSKAKVNAVRIHDIFPITNPEWFRKSSVRIFRKNLDSTIDRKSIFIANSEATKESLISTGKISIGDIYEVPCALTIENPIQCQKCPGCNWVKQLLEREFNLMVGTIEPRKNYEALVNFYKNFDIPFPTVVIGRKGWKSRKIVNLLQKTPGIIWVPKCCDGALTAFYKTPKTFLSLSKNEGFNLSALEATHHNVKVVLSDIKIHRELHPNSEVVSLDDIYGWVTVLSQPRSQDNYLHNFSSAELNNPSNMNNFGFTLEKIINDRFKY